MCVSLFGSVTSSLLLLTCQVQSAGVQSGAAMSPSAQSPVKGLAAVVVCCCLSGFANVFFEKLLKGGKQSVWMRNIQLGLSGTILGALAVWINDGSKVRVQVGQ